LNLSRLSTFACIAHLLRLASLPWSPRTCGCRGHTSADRFAKIRENPRRRMLNGGPAGGSSVFVGALLCDLEHPFSLPYFVVHSIITIGVHPAASEECQVRLRMEEQGRNGAPARTPDFDRKRSQLSLHIGTDLMEVSGGNARILMLSLRDCPLQVSVSLDCRARGIRQTRLAPDPVERHYCPWRERHDCAMTTGKTRLQPRPLRREPISTKI
jgi:hypothetical protein